MKQYIHEHARRPVKELRQGGEWNDETLMHLPPEIDLANDNTTLSAVHHPDDLLVVVAGGELAGGCR